MEIMVGASAGDIRLRDPFFLKEDIYYVDGRKRGFYGKLEER